MSLVIWLNIVTIVDRRVHRLPVYMRQDVNASRQCIVNDGLVDAVPNMQKTLHQFTTDKIVCYLQRIFNRNRKLKQQVSKLSALKLGVCSKINACYIFVCIFFQICQNSNFFHKVVRQSTEGMVGNYNTGFV